MKTFAYSYPHLSYMVEMDKYVIQLDLRPIGLVEDLSKWTIHVSGEAMPVMAHFMDSDLARTLTTLSLGDHTLSDLRTRIDSLLIAHGYEPEEPDPDDDPGEEVPLRSIQ